MIARSADIHLRARPRGIHLVTAEVLAALDLGGIAIGTCHLFLRHTSAALALNENASPDVRSDLQRTFDRLVPRGERYAHDDEGPDDMPAHALSVLVGAALLLPVRGGALALGTWQGIYLCEFRDRAAGRDLLVTAMGSGASE